MISLVSGPGGVCSESPAFGWPGCIAEVRRLDVSQLRRLKELETENARLKKMYAELSLNH